MVHPGEQDGIYAILSPGLVHLTRPGFCLLVTRCFRWESECHRALASRRLYADAWGGRSACVPLAEATNTT